MVQSVAKKSTDSTDSLTTPCTLFCYWNPSLRLGGDRAGPSCRLRMFLQVGGGLDVALAHHIALR